ncbi:hypothetical protein D3C80_1942380 [compost metagenome]
MFLEGVAEVGVGGCGFALEGGPGVHDGNVVVFQDAEVDIATTQLKAVAHHVDDAVAERMQFTEGVAAVALDVDQGLAIAVAHGKVADRA